MPDAANRLMFGAALAIEGISEGAVAVLPGADLPLGAEEDGFALKRLEREEEGDAGVNTGGDEDKGDRIPVVGTGDDFLTDQAGVENRNQSQLGRELDAGHH